MGGGLMQLVAYGAQDVYLTGNPQITFFKVVYRRHTNFSMEAIQQTINGSSGGAVGSSGTVTISRNGDLVHKVYVVNNTASLAGAVAPAVVTDGQQIFDVVDLEIGGQLIDRQNWLWREIYHELTTPESKAKGVKAMTFSGTATGRQLAGRHLLNTPGDIVIPLHFWFCNNPGLALPLIALQYHEVKIKINWFGQGTNNQVWCDYIYLDTDERRRFAQVSHEYLIEQVQMQGIVAGPTQRLNFNHPVKELIWTSQALDAAGQPTAVGLTYQNARITLNGHDRFATRNETYFQVTQPLQHHTAVPGTNIVEYGRPQLLNNPINTGVLIHRSGAALPLVGQSDVTRGLTTITYATPADAAAAGYRLGDIISMTTERQAGGVGAGGAPTAVVLDPADPLGVAVLVPSTNPVVAGLRTVTAIAGAVITFFPAFVGVLVDAAGLSIHILARTQVPLARCSAMPEKINCYSFALKPEEHQPSGTCNFSRIDTARLETGVQIAAAGAPNLQIYAVNYNVLRIMSGMGGLAYSN